MTHHAQKLDKFRKLAVSFVFIGVSFVTASDFLKIERQDKNISKQEQIDRKRRLLKSLDKEHSDSAKALQALLKVELDQLCRNKFN